MDRSPDDHAIFELARTYGLTFYGDAYLELAVRQGAIARLDTASIKAGFAEGVVVM